MATSRLRKTFRYNHDEDEDENDDNQREDMDEEEQENLIHEIQLRNQSMNDLYIQAFTMLPLICIPIFLFHFLRSDSIGSVRLLCLLSITSLGGSAFRMWFVPFTHAHHLQTSTNTNIHTNRTGNFPFRSRNKSQQTKKIHGLDLQIDFDGPLAKNLPYLNGGICVLLTLSAWGVKNRRDVPEGFWMLLLVPIVLFGMVDLARRSMSDVDLSIEGLKGLRYDYKGA